MSQAVNMMAGFRKQPQAKKTPGSDKAYRAALRQQRRNQARQTTTADATGEDKKHDDSKETEDSDSKNKNEIGETKKKTKGPSIVHQYAHVIHNTILISFLKL